MKKYKISNLIRVIIYLYDKATSAVLFNGNVEDWGSEQQLESDRDVYSHQPS